MTSVAFETLPGGEIITKGISDLRKSLRTEEALAVLIARPRLMGLGFEIPDAKMEGMPFEHELYTLLDQRLARGAHAEYNAIIRRLVSFALAYEQLTQTS